MPDLSMCDNDKCPKRNYCYRFVAVPFKVWQSWAHYDLEEYQGGCFLALRRTDKIRKASSKDADKDV